MKIHRLELHNFTSFKGRHIIDFDEIVKEGDLLAITGPTGAGKSSLLYAISLALYGKTKDGLVQGDLITSGETEGSIELHFSVNGKRYISHWECSLFTKKGARRPIPEYKRLLLEEGTPTTKIIDDILQLDYSQFSKTMILNQGRFSDFLMSNFTKRKEIIEKLYPNELIKRLAPYLREKTKELEQQIAYTNTTKEIILPFSNEEYQERICRRDQLIILTSQQKTERDLFLQAHREINTALDLTQKQISLQERMDALSRESKEKCELYNQELSLYLNLEQEAQSTAERDSTLIPLLQNGLVLEQKIEAQTRSLLDLEDRETKLQEKITTLEKKCAHLKDAYHEKKSEITTLEDRRKLRSIDIAMLRQLKQTLHEIEVGTSRIDTLREQIFFVKNSIEREESAARELAQQLKSHPIHLYPLPPQNMSQTDYMLAKECKMEKVVKELTESLLLLDIEKENQRQNRSKESALLLQLKTLEQQQSDNLQQSTPLGIEIRHMRSELLKQEETLAIIKCQRILHLSGVCPVCSKQSQKQPESIQTEGTLDTNVIAKKLIQQEGKLSELQREQDILRHKIGQLKVELSEISHALQSRDEATLLTEQQKLQEALELHTLELQVIKSTAKRYQEDQLLFQNIEAKQNDKIIQINHLVQRLTDLQDQESHLNGEILLKRRSLPTPLESCSVSDSIKLLEGETLLLEKHQKDEYLLQTITNDIEQTELLLIESKHSQTEIGQAIAEKRESLEVYAKELQKLNLQGSCLLALQTIEKNAKEIQNKLILQSKQKHAAEMAKNSLQASIFHTKEQSDLLTTGIQNAILSFKNHFKVFIDQYKISDTKFLTLLELHATDAMPALRTKLQFVVDDFLTPYNLQLENREKEGKTEHLKLNAEITLYEEKFIELQKHLEINGKREIELKIKQQLLAAIQGENFRNFTLSLLEEELIALANNELERLCDGRYKLILKDTDFLIKDTYCFSELRKVASLSGGETFMISLALALSLSEISRGSTTIDSFFIDEGFGTLDQDHIEEVLQTLLNIRNRGKQIGIISHVKHLTDRIPVNLNIKKDGPYFSRIETVYN